MFRSPPARVTRFGTALLSAGLLVISFAPRPAYAISGCRTDPVVVLSNLGVVDMNTYLPDASISDIKQVRYTLHVPVGTRALLVVYTYGLLGVKEKIQIVSDEPPNTYDSDIVVETYTAGHAVTATTTLGLNSKSVDGADDQDLYAHFSQ